MSRLKQTRAMAELAPWLFMAGNTVVVNKDSTLLASYAFSGMDEEGMASSALNDLVRRVGSALRGWDDRPVHLWWTLRRRRILDYPEASFPDPISARIDANRRRAFVEGRQFRNTHFLSPCLMPERASARLADRVRTGMQEGRGFWSAIGNALRLTFDPAAAFAYSAQELDTQVERFEALLSDFTEPLRDLYGREFDRDVARLNTFNEKSAALSEATKNATKAKGTVEGLAALATQNAIAGSAMLDLAQVVTEQKAAAALKSGEEQSRIASAGEQAKREMEAKAVQEAADKAAATQFKLEQPTWWKW